VDHESITPSTRSIVISVVLTITVLVVFGVLRWLDVPAGALVDWLVGIASFWWLMGIVTIPWNIYFGAREVEREMETSREREIEISETDEAYAGRMARRSLAGALALHVGSAIGFWALAHFGGTEIGYFSAAAALGLTAFRPAARAYRYVAHRLRDIRRRVRYPRDDIQDALGRLERHEARIDWLEALLDRSSEASWAYRVDTTLADHEREHERIEDLVESYQRDNRQAHAELERQSERVAERLREDSEFVGHIRELIRFVKSA
jgi:hypothetical protein